MICAEMIHKISIVWNIIQHNVGLFPDFDDAEVAHFSAGLKWFALSMYGDVLFDVSYKKIHT